MVLIQVFSFKNSYINRKHTFEILQIRKLIGCHGNKLQNVNGKFTMATDQFPRTQGNDGINSEFLLMDWKLHTAL